MKATKLHDMSDEELGRELGELRRSLFNLRLQKATGQLEKSHKLREARKDIARVLTIITERQTAATGEEAR